MLSFCARPMISKCSQLRKGLTRVFSEEIRKPDLIKTGNLKEVFIDREKFQATGSYLIYKASNLKKVRMIFFASLGLCSYHTYSYFYGEEPEFDKVQNTLFASLSAITIAWTS